MRKIIKEYYFCRGSGYHDESRNRDLIRRIVVNVKPNFWERVRRIFGSEESTITKAKMRIEEKEEHHLCHGCWKCGEYGERCSRESFVCHNVFLKRKGGDER